MTNNPHFTSLVSVGGLLGTITLDIVNTTVAICVGVLTMAYLAIKIHKELK